MLLESSPQPALYDEVRRSQEAEGAGVQGSHVEDRPGDLWWRGLLVNRVRVPASLQAADLPPQCWRPGDLNLKDLHLTVITPLVRTNVNGIKIKDGLATRKPLYLYAESVLEDPSQLDVLLILFSLEIKLLEN